MSSKDDDTALAAVRALAARLDDEPSHARQVARLAGMLFDLTRAYHQCTAAERRLLQAAALLHDIGYSIDPAKHHKHARDLILKEDLPGFSEEERRIIACIARYHRGAEPKPAHKVYGDLTENAQHVVCVLAGLLRIADGLDRSHQSSAKKLDITTDLASMQIQVTQEPPCDLDLWGANRKSALLAREIMVEIEIVRA